jgi:nicotinamide phosphoribosyltransferase
MSTEMAVEPEEKGAIECLWDVFGGTINEKGYKVLNERVGLIYGDSITLERADEICRRLEAKGFASTNVVFGIGSYTYNYVTRDSCGFAMKATSVVVKGERRAIFKDPKTDSGTKKSAKGLLYVDDIMNGGKLTDDVSEALEAWRYNNLSTVYEDGELIFETTFNEVQANVENSL